MACGTQSLLLSVTTSFPLLSLLSQSFYPRVSQSGFVTSAQTLIHDNLCPPSFGKWHSKSSNLLSLSPTFSVNPEANRVLDNSTSFFSSSPSSNFLMSFNLWLSISVGQPIAAGLHFCSLPQWVMCSTPQTNALIQLVFGVCFHTQQQLIKFNICATIPYIEIVGQPRISATGASFPRSMASVSWLA